MKSSPLAEVSRASLLVFLFAFGGIIGTRTMADEQTAKPEISGWASSRHSQWFFLPCFRNKIDGLQMAALDEIEIGRTPKPVTKFIETHPTLSSSEKALMVWRNAVFPHQDFVKLMPQNNVFGWYANVFDMPDELQGLDLLLDLGIIDDADETYLNGKPIGKTGIVPGGSAWQTDRLYRIPAELVTAQNNILASHVWSLWGLGGIVGPPVLKAALVSTGAQWELAFIKDAKAPKSKLNRVTSTSEALTMCFGETSPAWQKAAIPWTGWRNWPVDAHFAVFRTTLRLPEKNGQTVRFHSPTAIDIGPVFDVAAVFLNNRRIGLTGRFPEDGEPAFTEAARRGQYLVSPLDWNANGDNLLTIVVYRERGIGGLPGVPGILLENPVKPLRNNPSVAECFASFDILLQSLKYEEAEHNLDQARPENDLNQVWLLSHRAHLAFLKWLEGGRKDNALLDDVLAPVAEILTKYPVESPKQSSMQAFCRVLRLADKDEQLIAKVRCIFPDFEKRCHFQGIDAATRGDWMLSYGTHGWLLPAMGQITDWKSPNVRLNSEATGNTSSAATCTYSLSIPGEKDFPRLWLAGSLRKVSGSSALLMPFPFLKQLEGLSKLGPENLKLPLFDGKALRRASWWDDHGEMHPFDDEGPDFTVLLNASAPIGRLALYFYDIDWSSTCHPRQESLVLFSASGSLLNACWIGKMENGRYFRFVLSDASVSFRINKHRGACTSLSGLFLDGEKHWIEPDLEDYVQVRHAAESSQSSANMAHSAAVAGDVGNTARLSDSACMLVRKMSEIEYNGHYRITLAYAAGMLSSLKTIDEVADALWCIDKCGRHGWFWKLGLLSRAFEIMESMHMEEIQQEADRLSAVLCSSSKDNWPFHKIIARYCRQKEVPENSAEVKRIDKRIPNWSNVQTTIQDKGARQP